MPSQRTRRCLLAKRIAAFGVLMSVRCEVCDRRNVECRVDPLTGRCSECVRSGRNCSLNRSALARNCSFSRLLVCCLLSIDERMVAEQERLRSEARKAEESMARKAEEMAALAARAARLRKQLDFLEGRDRRLLRSELECLDLLDEAGVQLPEDPASVAASPSSFSDVLGMIDWSSLESLDAAGSRS